MTGSRNVPAPGAGWEAITAYAESLDGYRLAGSFERCAELANQTADAYRAAGMLPDDDRQLRIALFFEVRRYALMGPDRGDEIAYILGLIRALARNRERGAA